MCLLACGLLYVGDIGESLLCQHGCGMVHGGLTLIQGVRHITPSQTHQEALCACHHTRKIYVATLILKMQINLFWTA